MKTSRSLAGGELKSQFMSVYADYFVRYIKEMSALGIPIWAITPQNEPLNSNNNPSLVMQASQQKSITLILSLSFSFYFNFFKYC